MTRQTESPQLYQKMVVDGEEMAGEIALNSTLNDRCAEPHVGQRVAPLARIIAPESAQQVGAAALQ